MILEDKKHKAFKSPTYNFLFNKISGNFVRWGKDMNDDPDYSPYGPEIADIEISTICRGLGTPCTHCYKSNTAVGENMSLETFKKVFAVLPKTITQIAFGIGDIDANPDMFPIFDYCRQNEVVPNVTINGYKLTDEIALRLSKTMGAIAVSRYNPPDFCYNAVKKLTDLGMKQVNIHMLLSEETYDDCIQVVNDATTDPRLAKLNAIVFLGLKPKGKRNTFNVMRDKTKFKALLDLALSKKVGIGFDSCSANKVLEAADDKRFETFIEPCESQLFSTYCNCEGTFFPCSFSEGKEGVEGIKLEDIKNFEKDVWYNAYTQKWRNELINNKGSRCRVCPLYNID